MAGRKKREASAAAWVGARALDQELTRKGIGNTELAAEIGVTHATVSRYRSGERAPDPDTLARICRAARLSADELLGLKPLSREKQIDELEGALREALAALRTRS